MPVNLLSDVDVIAISLVDKAANKKKIYLRKSENEDLLSLPAPHRILKADDNWSTFYSVVAEPGWRENPGSGSPGETFEDEWASEDEIRKAAHRFMANGALVNRMHESLEPYGRLVENFIAQSDFEVDGETIKKGSWVVGIQPSEEGRLAIEEGKLAGISIQGSGIRQLDITKSSSGYGGDAKKCPSCGGAVKADVKTCQNCGHSFSIKKTPGPPGTDISRNQGKQFGPLKNLIAYYMKKKHPFTACVRDNRKRFGPRAENVCAALKDIGMQTTHWRNSNKIAKADDIHDEDFGEAIVIWKRHGLTEEDATMAFESMTEAQEQNILQKFATFLKGEVEAEETKVEKQEDEVTDTTKTTEPSAEERFATAAENLEKSTKAIETLANNLGTIAQKLVDGKSTNSEEDEENSGEKLSKQLDDLESGLAEMRESVEKLAQGQSTQREDKVEKSNNDPLAGLLFD